MALVHKDRVKETSTTTGTGPYALLGAVADFQAFSVIGNGNTCYYTAFQAGVGWEVGIGTWSTGGNLARTTILASTNGDAAVDWPAGTRTLFNGIPAGKFLGKDDVLAYLLTVDGAGSGLDADLLDGNEASVFELIANKDTDGTLAANSDTKYPSQKAAKTYIDNLIATVEQNLGNRQRVRAATTASITIATALNNGDTLDGVSLVTGDLVLVKNQSGAGADNGIYVVGVVPVRYSEFDTYNEHPGSLIVVEEGTANADTLWFCTSNVGGTLEVTAIAFSQLGPYQPLDSDLTAIAALSTTSYGRALLALADAAALTALLNAVVGDSGSGGTKGAVPAPAAGDAAAGKYLKADGTWATAGGFTAASQAEMEAASSTTVGSTPGRQHFHPGHPKMWGYVTVSGGTPTLQTSFNVTSITDTAGGQLTVTIATDFSTTNWCLHVTVELPNSFANSYGMIAYGSSDTAKAAGSVLLIAAKPDASNQDPVAWNFSGIGDQA